jgi:hypothetical protein
MSEKKVVRRSVAIALGIICIILAVGLIGALALLTPTHNSQSNLQSWTEGSFYFNLTQGHDMNSTIPTEGFRSVTITIDSWGSLDAYQVFIGFITANTTLDYHVYDVQPLTLNPIVPLPPRAPPWWGWDPYICIYSNGTTSIGTPCYFRQTYEITFSKIMVWIWNNSTNELWGNVYYYLTT